MRARTGDTLPGKKSDPGGTAADSRPFVEAVLWRFRTGSPWRGIPERSGGNDSVSRRFRRWVLPGVSGCVSGGGTVVQAHRKAAGARGARAQGIGRPGGGLTTRAVAVVDALGCPVRFTVLPGQAHDLNGVPDLPGGLPFGTPVGDGASGADWLLEDLDARGAEAVIPSRRNRTARRGRDRDVYGRRRPVESFFAGTGEFRAIATRYDRTDGSFAAGIHPVAGVVAAR
ncbi:MAG: IS5 family transposase [Rhodobacter sp.]|nr:IS5 family transposase [Rhodobacter sp.]